MIQSSAIAAPTDYPAATLDILPGQHLSAGGVAAMNGYEFSPTENVTVTALGVYDLAGCTFRPSPCADGLLDSHQVGIWDSTGVLLETATVPSGTNSEKVGEFRYVSIASLELMSGQTYVVASLNPAHQLADEDDGWVLGPNGSSSNYSFDSRISFIQGRRQAFIGGFQYPSPTTVMTHPGFGGSFLIEGDATPLTPPTADAGADQAIRAGNIVFLDGGNSFDDDTPTSLLTYEWTLSLKPLNSMAMLSSEGDVFSSFTADLAGTYMAGLIVTDEDSLSSSDTVEISTANLAPQAEAGNDQLVIVGDSVLLDGTNSSDPEGETLAFDWTIISKPSESLAPLSTASNAVAGLVPDVEGTYVVSLVVNDAIGPGDPDTIEVTATLAEAFAEIQIIAVDSVITALDPDAGEVTTAGNQEAYGNFLSQATVAIQDGDIAAAIDKLEKAISRTDGCALRGAVDGKGQGRDWVTSCAEQDVIYPTLIQALEALIPQ